MRQNATMCGNGLRGGGGGGSAHKSASVGECVNKADH